MDKQDNDAKLRARAAQARFRVKTRAHLDHLTSIVDTKKLHISQRKTCKLDKERKKMDLMQRCIEVANELVSICDERLKTTNTGLPSPPDVSEAPHKALNSCWGNAEGTQLQTVRQSHNLYTVLPQEPRSIDSFESFADISYRDLATIFESFDAERRGTCPDGPSQSQTFKCARYNAADLSASIPGFNTVNEPVDTSLVTLRSLAEEHMRGTCTKMQVLQSDTCWWVGTNFPISRSHTLAFSSQLGSRECAASCVLSLMMATFEFVLFTLSVEDIEGVGVEPLPEPSHPNRPATATIQQVRQKLMAMSARWGDSAGGPMHASHAHRPRPPFQHSPDEAPSFVRSRRTLIPAEQACMHAVASMLCRYIGILPFEKLELAVKRMINYITKGYKGLSAATGKGSSGPVPDTRSSEPSAGTSVPVPPIPTTACGATAQQPFRSHECSAAANPVGAQYLPAGTGQHSAEVYNGIGGTGAEGVTGVDPARLHASAVNITGSPHSDGSLERQSSKRRREALFSPIVDGRDVQDELAQYGREDELDAELARIQATLANTSTAKLLHHVTQPPLEPRQIPGLNANASLEDAPGAAAPECGGHPRADSSAHESHDPVAPVDTAAGGDAAPQNLPQDDAQAPETHGPGGYLTAVMEYFLELFAGLGNSLACAQHELAEMGVLPLDEELRCTAGLAALERVATTSVLDCMLTLLMAHYHSKATISFLTLDLVSPYVTHAEVENMHMRLYKYLSPSDLQRDNMAMLWKTWLQRRRNLNGAQHRALHTLDTLLASSGTNPAQLHSAAGIAVPPHCTEVPSSRYMRAAHQDAACHVPQGPMHVDRNKNYMRPDDSLPNMRVCADCGLVKDGVNKGGIWYCKCVFNHIWPGLLGQCPVATGKASSALLELQDVGHSDARLYDGFLEVRLHPNDMLSSRQIMAIISENLKTASMPTDYMALFQLAMDHHRHQELFENIASLVL